MEEQVQALTQELQATKAVAFDIQSGLSKDLLDIKQQMGFYTQILKKISEAVGLTGDSINVEELMDAVGRKED